MRLLNERKLEGMKEKWWNQNPNKADVSANLITLLIHLALKVRYQLLYLTFLLTRTVKKTRRILELSPSTPWVVSSLSSLLASSLLSSSLHLSIVTTRRRIILWSRSQSLVKMSKRIFDCIDKKSIEI